MAHIIPSDITRAALAGARAPELETLQTPRDGLPNDYTVFHGVHWSREYKSWSHFGEIDFVVINRAGDVLFIEQKNGALQETESGLTKQYEDRSQNLGEQIHRSIDKVRDKFSWQHGRDTHLAVDYLVYLPDYRVRKLNAIGLDEARIVDAGAKGSLAARIGQLLGPGRRDAKHGASASSISSARPVSWCLTSRPTTTSSTGITSAARGRSPTSWPT